MEAHSNSNSIEKLVGRENYSSWKFAMQAYLQSEDLWGCIEGTESYISDTKKMTRARAKIILSVEKQNYTHLEGTTTPKEAWAKLAQTFEDAGLTRRVGLLKTLTSTRLRESKSIEEYVNRITSTAHRLKELNFEVKDEMVAALLLSGLPDEYKPMIMGLESSGIAITADAVKIKLLQEIQPDETTKNVEKEAAFIARSNTKQRNDSKKKKCFICQKPGHFAAKCRQRQTKGNDSKGGTAWTAFIASENKVTVNTWHLDSCASSHMTANADWLQKSETINSSVNTANNGKLTAIARGTVELYVRRGKQTEQIFLKDVLHVPKLAANLLSVSKIVEKGNSLFFDKGECKIKNSNGKIVATAKPEGGIYCLQTFQDKAWMTKKEETEDDSWHRKLGHLNRISMKLLAKGYATGMEDVKVNQKQCEVCIKGKSIRLPFQSSGKRASEVLELIHSDLCGPMSVDSVGGAKYFLIFIDDYSRQKYVYFLKHKNEAAEVFSKYKRLVEKQTGHKIKTIRTDNGKEYVNSKFKQILDDAGIVHETTVPYTPQQNGVAERANRTVVEKARTMLNDSNLPKKLWAEATYTAIYLLNRSPTKAVKNKTPQEAWSGRKPDLKHLQIFGTEAMVHTPKEKRDKWDPKAEKLIFVGYASNTKGYRLYNPKNGKITISRDVIFLDKKEASQVNIKDANTNMFQCSSETKMSDIDEEDSVDSDETDETTIVTGNGGSEANQREMGSNMAPRRSERKWKPITKEGYVSYYTVEEITGDPNTVKEALEAPDSERWVTAMNREYKALKKNDTWEYAKIPTGVKPLTTKWIFKKKLNEGHEPTYKARLVVRGCTQTYGVDYFETYSPVVRYSSIRYLLALTVKEDLNVTHMDVSTAYLHSELAEEIYVNPPKELRKPKYNGMAWKLKKTMYGLKQSGRAWYQKLDKTLTEHCLKRSTADPCVYYSNEGDRKLIVAIYVDDLLILSNDVEKEEKLKARLKKEFKMKDLGKVQQFLGMNIERDEDLGEMTIHQRRYIESVLNKFGMADCKPVGTPMDPGAKLFSESTQSDDEGSHDVEGLPFLEAIGSLLYISQISRPDIAFAVNSVSSFSKNPKRVHWNAIKRIFRYLKGTLHYKLSFQKSMSGKVTGYSDADWANDPKTRKSVTGTVFTMCGGAISWFSKRQRTVALSTVEAEYIALAFTCQEGIWLRNLVAEIEPCSKPCPLKIYCDNTGAVGLSKNSSISQRTKHIDVRYHFLQEIVESGVIAIEHLVSEKMIADMFTKPLHKPKIEFFTKKLGLVKESSALLEEAC